jgi:ubiquinone/menaquinone biosynthesis C-methylase UbiE
MPKAGIHAMDYPWWLAYAFDNPIRRLLHHPGKLLRPYVRPGDVAADLGCGMGYFTGALAELTRPSGHVYAIDRQTDMLARTKRRIRRKPASDRVSFHSVPLDEVAAPESVDFVLAFWMVHEVRGKTAFLTGIRKVLKPSGRMLLVEPLGHVSMSRFESERSLVRDVGFITVGTPHIALSRALLLAPAA